VISLVCADASCHPFNPDSAIKVKNDAFAKNHALFILFFPSHVHLIDCLIYDFLSYKCFCMAILGIFW
jgi:hypothetical protein